MQITITGPRGGGATTLALMIAELLQKNGMTVDYVSGSNEQRHDFLLKLKQPKTRTARGKLRAARVVIVDGVEREDARSVEREIES